MVSTSGTELFTKFASADTFATKVAAVLGYLAVTAYHARQLPQARVLAKAAQAMGQGAPLVQAFEKAGCDQRLAVKQALAATRVALRLQKRAAGLDLNSLFANTMNDEATRHQAIQKFLQKSTANAASSGGAIGGGTVGAAAGAVGLPMLLRGLLRKVPNGGALGQILSKYLKPGGMGPLQTPAGGFKLPFMGNAAAATGGAVGGSMLGSRVGGAAGSMAGSAPPIPAEATSPIVQMMQNKGKPAPAPKAPAAPAPVKKAESWPTLPNGQPIGPGLSMPPQSGAQPGQINPRTAAILASILGIGGAAMMGGNLGMGVGAPLGAAVGMGRGNTAEGLGRGMIRGGTTGAGAALGALAGGSLGAMTGSPDGMALGAAAGGGAGGLAGYIGGGKLIGKPAGRAEEEQY